MEAGRKVSRRDQAGLQPGAEAICAGRDRRGLWGKCSPVTQSQSFPLASDFLGCSCLCIRAGGQIL